jgi:integrase
VNTAKVVVYHSKKCPDRRKGSQWRKCNCMKSIQVYTGGGAGKNRRLSAHTRSWERAEKFCQEWLDQFDPEKQELKRLRAEKERKEVRIEEAVALYCADMVARLGDNGSVAMMRSLLGHIDPDTKAVVRNGHLFDWLDKLSDRPTYISEISPAMLTAWRASWTFGDLTAAQRWGMVKGFFAFCEAQGWVDDSPARKLKPPSVNRGGRTAIFTDEQYAAIVDAVYLYEPENVPEATRNGWQQRLEAFIELLRWSGMALIDAVQFKPEQVDSEGVLRYRRQKTNELATVPMPANVVALLRNVPLERDSVGPEQPFRSKDVPANSDTRKWQRRVCEVFKLAGITEVRTERGSRKPHPHMLRDTFAVWHLRHGAKLHTVAKMLGHSKTTTTEQSYLPWVKELEQAHIEDARQALAHGAPKGGKIIKLRRA